MFETLMVTIKCDDLHGVISNMNLRIHHKCGNWWMLKPFVAEEAPYGNHAFEVSCRNCFFVVLKTPDVIQVCHP